MVRFAQHPRAVSRIMLALMLSGLVLAITTLATAEVASAARLEDRVRGAVRSSPVQAYSSVLVYDADRSRVVYMYKASHPRVPASNQKLLTAAGVLHGLGPNYQLRTQVAIRGTVTKGVLKGNVFLIGGGDPTLATRAYRQRYMGGRGGKMELLAAALQRQGIKRVKGRLIVDETFFDKQRYVSTWKTSYRYDESPALGGLVVNRNSGSGRRIASPGKQAGLVFRSMLAQRGIRFSGPTTMGRAPLNSNIVGVAYSPQMNHIVRTMNTYSDNFTAEMLLKTLGRLRGGEGSSQRGAAIVKQRLRMLNVSTSGMRVADGSGLSSANRVTTRQIGEILNAIDQNLTLRWSWRNSMAVSGRTGTIRQRMSTAPYKGRIIAKTGTLNSASALSGYATRLSGRRFGFSVIQNRSSGSVPLNSSHVLQDRIARILVR